MNVIVTEVEHYTDTLFRIKTKRPQSFKFTAGEFTMIGMGDNDIMRAYSITSGPFDEELEFYSIKVSNGPLTSRLQHIKVGEELEVGEKPTGTLTLANIELGGNLHLIGTGTGIAPFISLLRDPNTYDLFDTVNVYWSVRNSAELEAYNNFLKELPINYMPIVTREEYVNNKRITEYVKDGIVQLNPAQDKVMLCGSMEFNKDMTQLLLERGFEEGNRRTAGTFVLEKAFVS
jgi:ferredoxin/flavodoxin---NADP+ reductase